MKAAIEARLSATEQTRLNNDYANQVSDAATPTPNAPPARSPARWPDDPQRPDHGGPYADITPRPGFTISRDIPNMCM